MKIFNWSEDTLLERIRAVCMTITGMLIVIFICLFIAALIAAVITDRCACEEEAEQQDLPHAPNYDKESLLDLMEQGECAGATIHEGQFSIFVCKN